MKDKITPRPALLSDCPAISDIYNYYVRHDTCTYQEVPERLEEREQWFRDHGPQYPVIVAESEGRIVGWASLSPYNKRSGYRYTVENSVYLDPEWRQKGIGTVLLQELIDRATALGYRTMIAVISAEQVASIKIHEKFGFIQGGHLKGIGLKFSQRLDVLYYQLELKP
jgi:phosphinothricin acetyltransferase